MHLATFVLSTGRCGTQWLAQAFDATFGARMLVEHEPLHNDYQPRAMLGAKDPAALGKAGEAILRHVERIERELEARDYFEAGHPCWSSLPWLIRRLAGRIRIVHLVRHPVPTACSWVSHGAYVPPLLPHMAAKELILPTDAGVAFPDYAGAWPTLVPMEKCLYYWAEVNAFGLRLERESAVPWLRVRYEDLFGPGLGALQALATFLGLPADAADQLERGEVVDRYRYGLGEWPEPERIARHPRIVALAESLGYRADAFSSQAIAGRFACPAVGGDRSARPA